MASDPAAIQVNPDDYEDGGVGETYAESDDSDAYDENGWDEYKWEEEDEWDEDGA